MARVLKGIFGGWLQPGVDPKDGLRQDPIDEGVIESLGQRFKYVDRDDAAKLMLEGANKVYRRQQGAKELEPDTLKELPAFIGRLLFD